MNPKISTPVTEQPLFLESHQIAKLQEQEDVVTFAALEPEERLDLIYYPACIMKIATEALIAEDHAQGGKNFNISKALAKLRFAGVPIIC